MYVFKAYSSTAMAHEVYTSLAADGIHRDSRNGPVICLPAPVSMTYKLPMQRCNFTKGRDANPFFHHFESLWMLAGRRDVKFVEKFNSNIGQYSDDGVNFNAAYGYRARHHFGHDQIQEAIWLLEEDPESRQAVVQLWDHSDLTKITKDKACNMLMVFSCAEDDQVDLMVFNRSNDAVYGGVSGANPVHFSYFLQYVAEQLKRFVGKLTFVSNNLHVYTELYDKWNKMEWERSSDGPMDEHYRLGELSTIEHFCNQVMTDQFITTNNTDSPTINNLSIPMWNYWLARGMRNRQSMFHYLQEITSPGWRRAIQDWEANR
jgi:thymidylate synthase